MKSFFNLLLLTFILSSCLNCKKNDAHKIESEKEWISIFNGKNLEDWIVKINGHKLGDNYLNGGEGCGGVFEKDSEKAARWYRKAEKKIKSVMVIDIDNKDVYRKNLELVRFKRDIAEGG